MTTLKPKPKIKCQFLKHTPDNYIQCTASSGEEFAIVCPADTIPLFRPTELIDDHRFFCGTIFVQPRTAADWLYIHRDALIPFAAFVIGMLIAVLVQSWRRWKILIVRR